MAASCVNITVKYSVYRYIGGRECVRVNLTYGNPHGYMRTKSAAEGVGESQSSGVWGCTRSWRKYLIGPPPGANLLAVELTRCHRRHHQEQRPGQRPKELTASLLAGGLSGDRFFEFS